MHKPNTTIELRVDIPAPYSSEKFRGKILATGRVVRIPQKIMKLRKEMMILIQMDT